MRLETEFRLCLLQRSLEWALQQSSNTTPTAPISANQSVIAPAAWVKLLYLPSASSADEALLLCQCSAQQWLAWIPDYGEVMLERRQFESLFE